MNCLNNGNRKSVMKKLRIYLYVLSAILLLAGCAAKETTSLKKSGLKVHYLSVGQADAILIECDGHNAMIDCGNSSVVSEGFKSYTIDMYLRQEKIDSFAYIFCSHYDADHYDGFADILSNRKFKDVYGPSGAEKVDTRRMNAFKSLIHERRKKIQKKIY